MNCKVCKKRINKFEIYTTFYYCGHCDKTHDYEKKGVENGQEN